MSVKKLLEHYATEGCSFSRIWNSTFGDGVDQADHTDYQRRPSNNRTGPEIPIIHDLPLNLAVSHWGKDGIRLAVKHKDFPILIATPIAGLGR